MIKEVLDYLKHAGPPWVCHVTKDLCVLLVFHYFFFFFVLFKLHVLLPAPLRSINNSLEQKGFESTGHSGMHHAKHDRDLSFM